MIEEYMSAFLGWLLEHNLNIVLSLVLIIIFSFFRRIINPKIEKYVTRDDLKNETLESAVFSLSIFSWLITLVLLLFIWGFDFKTFLALSTGLVALTGAALFASWSILSNVTAFFILLVHKTYTRGNYIRVIEADNYIEGYISELSLFNTKLLTVDEEIIIYPNNLLIARPTIINPKKKYAAIGKTEEFKIKKDP